MQFANFKPTKKPGKILFGGDRLKWTKNIASFVPYSFDSCIYYAANIH